MGNMSYCRFKNTSQDLGDCLDAIENNELDELSSYEITGLRDLLDYCKTILEYKEEIEEAINKEENYG